MRMVRWWTAPHQTEMCTLVNHDLRAHWEAIVKRWGNWAADCGDFELQHKWALKQFVRVVPHGEFFTAHLAHRHLGQFAFAHGQDEAAAPEEPLRYCHCADCQAIPGTHPIHVHVVMPGLEAEDEQGRLSIGDRRSVKKAVVAVQHHDFQRALRRLMGAVQQVPMQQAHMPEAAYSANRMQLMWHGEDGKVQYQVTSVGCWSHTPPSYGLTFPNNSYWLDRSLCAGRTIY